MASSIYDYFYYLFFHFKPVLKSSFARKRYFISDEVGGHKELGGLYYELFPERIQAKTDEADLVCNHFFDLLGSGLVKLKADDSLYMDQEKTSSTMNHEPVDWHADFKSGYRWSKNTFFRFIRFGREKGIDIKVPWELSRFQHLIVLGQAYALTRNRKYIAEFQNQISDWIENNKVGFGINWSSTMDVAIRAANWLVASEYFYDNDILPEGFWRNFYTSIYEHARFIHRHLEYGPPPTNHYLSGIAGLLFISSYCPFFKESAEWNRFCAKELEKEIQKQVYYDGCSFEGSTSYHRLALEFFFYSALLAKRTGLNFSPAYHERLKKMFEFVLYAIEPNGKIPQIGDNDNGRFIPFSRRQTLDHTYLLSLAAVYFGEKEFKSKAFPYDEEAFWMFGKEGHRVWNQLDYRNDELGAKTLSDAGWYIIRHKDSYCFISCGPNGQNGVGGHAHNDKLGFEIVIAGQVVFVDPGTYVYTPDPDKRNQFRSTSYHNLIKFNGYEQNEFSEKNLFVAYNRITIEEARIKEAADKILFTGTIHYEDITHTREVILEKQSGSLIIKDRIIGNKDVRAHSSFHLHPDIFYDDGFIFFKKTNRKIASMYVEEGYPIVTTHYDYSPEYGVKTSAQCLMVSIPLRRNNLHVITVSVRKA